RAREARREGHREAARVGGADQLLRIGAGAALEPGLEGVGALEGAAPELDPALAFPQRAFPHGFRIPHRHRAPPAGVPEVARSAYSGCRFMNAWTKGQSGR